jgi:glutathione S-transferase
MIILDSVGRTRKWPGCSWLNAGSLGIPVYAVDLRGGENRQPPYLANNPGGQCPELELSDGGYLTEITAICEFLDETAPGTSLIGATPHERGESRMWTRRRLADRRAYCGLLAASRLAIDSASSSISAASANSATCSSVVALTIGAVTLGRAISHAMAIWPGFAS